MITAEFHVSIRAPVDRVWATIADYPGYTRFPGVRSARIVEPGGEHPAGVGALREIVVDGITFEERIVEFEPGRALGYRIVRSRPLPIEHQGGRMVLSERDGETHLDWSSTFRVGVPVAGDLLALLVRVPLSRTFRKILAFIKADLERG